MDEQTSPTAGPTSCCANCSNTTSVIWHRQPRKKSSTPVEEPASFWCNFCETKKRVALADAVHSTDEHHSNERHPNNVDDANDVKTNGTTKSGSKFASGNRKSKGSSSKTKHSLAHKQAAMTRLTKASLAVSNTRMKFRKSLRKPALPERSIFRAATVVTTGILWHRGVVFGSGDVVSVVDEVDDRVYYARIRGLLKDQFMNKFATLTWLLPTVKANLLDGSFDPLHFVAGPQDDKLYELDSLEFVQSYAPRKSNISVENEKIKSEETC